MTALTWLAFLGIDLLAIWGVSLSIAWSIAASRGVSLTEAITGSVFWVVFLLVAVVISASGSAAGNTVNKRHGYPRFVACFAGTALICSVLIAVVSVLVLGALGVGLRLSEPMIGAGTGFPYHVLLAVVYVIGLIGGVLLLVGHSGRFFPEICEFLVGRRRAPNVLVAFGLGAAVGIGILLWVFTRFK